MELDVDMITKLKSLRTLILATGSSSSRPFFSPSDENAPPSCTLGVLETLKIIGNVPRSVISSIKALPLIHLLLEANKQGEAPLYEISDTPPIKPAYHLHPYCVGPQDDIDVLMQGSTQKCVAAEYSPPESRDRRYRGLAGVYWYRSSLVPIPFH
jgi:hypothetical protein